MTFRHLSPLISIRCLIYWHICPSVHCSHMHCHISFYYVSYSCCNCSSPAPSCLSPLYVSALLCGHSVPNVSLGHYVRHQEPSKMVTTKHSAVFIAGDFSLVAISLDSSAQCCLPFSCHDVCFCWLYRIARRVDTLKQ
jgi:hypothetical protein